MSRKDIKGRQYDIAFGVDHVTGVFLQVWKKPADDQDCCFLKIEGKNLVADKDSEEYKNLNPHALGFINECVDRMQRGEGEYLSPEHVFFILQILDIYDDTPNLKSVVYQTLD